MEVEAILSEKPQSTLTEISSLTNISRTSVFRLIHSELKLKSHKIQIDQKLFEEDYARRVQTGCLATYSRHVIRKPYFL